MSILPPSPFSNPFVSSAVNPNVAESADASNMPIALDASAAIPISNSAGQVMLPADTAAPVMDPATVGVAVPINVIGHNPVTHAVEVRPIAACGSQETTVGDSAACDLLVGPSGAPAQERPLTLSESNDLIAEILVGADRLPQRELPPDFQQRLLAAIESDEIWADPPPLFLRQRSDNA